MTKMFLIPASVAGLLAGCAVFQPGAKKTCTCDPCVCTDGCACAICACRGCAGAMPNALTEQEKAEGWELLWDGKTSRGWVGEKEVKAGKPAFPDRGWTMKDGVLTVLPVSRIDENGKWQKLPADQAKGGGGAILTERKFRDFAFKCDFRLTAKANSGIKYFYDENVNGGTTLEYQILDPGHPDATHGRDGNRRVASLYDMIPANADKLLGPVGSWNTAMVVSKGNHVEHWLNGVKVIEYERGGAAFMEAFRKSKYAGKDFDKNGKWGLTPEGRIHLQDHSDSTVSYRNIKIREFK